jgi:hypothetical protein|tara:strand:+ start:309 stop:563 length:255 start_codon:yes stop_codon:yes gene_type:complete
MEKKMRLLITTFVFGLFMITTQVQANSWSYEEPGSSLQWNPYGNTWSYEDPGSSLMWNPYGNTWSYESPGSSLMWNPYGNSWNY